MFIFLDTFTILKFLFLKCVSHIQQVIGCCFLNSVLRSNNLFFLIRVLGQFKVNVIVNLIVLWFTSLLCTLSLLFLSYILILVLTFKLHLLVLLL